MIERKSAGSRATHRQPVGPANRGLPALQMNPLEPGRSERQRPGKLAMGWGPLFLLARPGDGFTSAAREGPVAGGLMRNSVVALL